jgi:4-hydroxybenzoyl-CoA thioesterase
MSFTFSRTVRIEWGDCDPAGIIFYPRYFEIFDASTALAFEAALGMTKFEMFKKLEFSGWPMVRTHARFHTFGRSSFDVAHKLTLNGELCVECTDKRVWTLRDAEGQLKSFPIPEAVLAKFQQ